MMNYTTPFWENLKDNPIFCAFDVIDGIKNPYGIDGKKGISHEAALEKRGTYSTVKALGYKFTGVSLVSPIEIDGQFLVCIDLDWKRSPTYKPEKEQADLMAYLQGMGAAYETSYSEKGAHFWILCDQDKIPGSKKLNNNCEIEIFSGFPNQRANVLLTDYDFDGQLISVDLTHKLPPKGTKEKTTTANSGTATRDELLAPLFAIPPGDYDVWLKVGMVLKYELGEDGYDLWVEWSKQSDKYDPFIFGQKWDSFKGDGLKAGTLIALALENGYKRPRASAAEDFGFIDPFTGRPEPIATPKLNPWFDRIRQISQVATVPNWLVDGILADKMTIVAGSPGVGKTSCMVPLALVVAGFQSHLSNITSKYNRKVVYVTEDKWQIDSIIHGVLKHMTMPDGKKVTYEMIAERFIVIETMKSKVSDLILLAEVAVGYMEDLAATSGTVEMRPLVVLDTSSATFMLDDENNNSEVSKYVAAIKESFINKDIPVWIVAHTAKINKRSDVAALSVRGAGAFEGDANCIAYLVQEENLATRFFVLGKHRYSATYQEIAIDSVVHQETAVNKYGDMETFYYRYSTLERSSEGSRIAAKMEAQEEFELSKDKVYKQRLLDKLMELGEVSPTELAHATIGKYQKNTDLIKKMLDANELTAIPGHKGGILLKPGKLKGTT